MAAIKVTLAFDRLFPPNSGNSSLIRGRFYCRSPTTCTNVVCGRGGINEFWLAKMTWFPLVHRQRKERALQWFPASNESVKFKDNFSRQLVTQAGIFALEQQKCTYGPSGVVGLTRQFYIFFLLKRTWVRPRNDHLLRFLRHIPHLIQ